MKRSVSAQEKKNQTKTCRSENVINDVHIVQQGWTTMY